MRVALKKLSCWSAFPIPGSCSQLSQHQLGCVLSNNKYIVVRIQKTSPGLGQLHGILIKSVEENLKFCNFSQMIRIDLRRVPKMFMGTSKRQRGDMEGKANLMDWWLKDFLLMIQIKDIIIRDRMISGELIELLCDFRRTESDHNLLFSTPFPLNDSLYHIYLQALLQTADNFNLQNTTKFMAKKYLDYFLSADSAPQEEKLLLVILTCLRVATKVTNLLNKFNQLSQISIHFSIEYCGQLSQGKYSQSQFLNCEIQLIKILGFKFRITTPYDYLVVKNLLPKEKKVLTLLESVIDFAITLIEVRSQTAEEIFFGALLYCCEQKNVSQLCSSITKATTFKWQEAQRVSTLVRFKINQLLPH